MNDRNESGLGGIPTTLKLLTSDTFAFRFFEISICKRGWADRFEK